MVPSPNLISDSDKTALPKKCWCLSPRFGLQFLEDGSSALCVFLDLARASDSVPHYRIIDALAAVGVCCPSSVNS